MGRKFARGSPRSSVSGLLALAAFTIVSSAQAQVVTFVSNTGQVDTAIGYYTDTQQRAQQFTTGDHTGGYTLSKVVVDIGNPCSIAPAFALYGSTTDGGMLEVPGAKIVDLVGSAASRGEQSFTPATATTLAHSTRYFVLFKTATAASITDCKVSRTISHSVDHGAASGWDIAGEAVFSPDAGETWTNTPSSPEDPPPPIQIAIRGSLIATDTAPGQPKNLTATPGNSRLALRWERPLDDGGAPIIRYEYRHAQDSSVPSNTSWQSAGLDLEQTIGGLSNGQQYTFQVRAVNRIGAGPARSIAATPVGAPGAPEGLTATPGDAHVVLTWTALADDGGAPIIRYEYRHRQSNQIFGSTASASWNDIPGGANARSHTVTGLTNEVEYTFEVRAQSAQGGGQTARTTATPSSTTVTSAESEEIPTQLTLMGNYPNPFNPETVIDYVLPQTSHIRLAVYDMTGKTVAVLMDGVQSQGRHTARFHADGLSTGTYVYRLTAGAKTLTRTMTLVR